MKTRNHSRSMAEEAIQFIIQILLIVGIVAMLSVAISRIIPGMEDYVAIIMLVIISIAILTNWIVDGVKQKKKTKNDEGLKKTRNTSKRDP